ncbi:hypothetical protein ACFTWD_05235 [Streptomyces sp. NPDC056943]|uniref:hypothetical protein n=1 Tax=Streptomyces sp. NPDC056943 TaxID=3345971 RepID=UPI003644A39C
MSASAVLALTGCVVGPAPRQVDFGFRLDGSGNVVVAYPLCATYEIAGASIYVDAKGEGEDGDGFTTLWSATDPTAEEAERGVFAVGAAAGFRQETRPLKAPLPDGFYVAVTELAAGKEKNGQDHWVTPSRLKGKQLAPGEYVTEEGKVLTRDQINAQAICPK